MPWWTWGKLTGALVRHIPATVVNVSSRGCLLETRSPLVAGTVGILEIDEAEGPSEVVRVCHSFERTGAAMRFRAGGEFLVLDAATAVSVRQRAWRLDAQQLRASPTVASLTGRAGASSSAAAAKKPLKRDDGDAS